MENKILSLRLASGYDMPLLGLGLFKVTDPDELSRAVLSAAECGYRLFDTASAYGNEEAAGNAFSAIPVPRDQLFITSKVWNNAQRIGDVEGAFSRSLRRMKLDYLDLYLIHWPVPGCYLRTWSELIRLKEKGLVRSIGVSNFEIAHLELLQQQTGVLPDVNQIEYHPLWNRKPLADYCRSHGIAVQAYAPLARGAYMDRAPLVKLAEKYGRTTAQIGLRYLVQMNVSAIPKSSNPDRIRSNSEIFDFELSDAEMQMIEGLDEHLRVANIPEDLAGLDLSH
ncbi:MAG: aldo/keto reductase [Bilifractor sp.]|jgi:diketogulonate reductase-like aldo/keto reductase